jgi:hypothetical protein
MPNFHFDIRDGGDRLPDDEGQYCADHRAAEAEAVQVAAEMVRGTLKAGDPIERKIEVRESGSDRPFVRVNMIAKIEIERLK